MNHHKKVLIIKLSSLAVSSLKGEVEKERIKGLGREIKTLQRDWDIVVVSSGAINLGRKLFSLAETKGSEVDELQACSAIGQPLLMKAFQDLWEPYGLLSAQVLLTHDDLNTRKRAYNVRSCLERLWEKNFIPIVNENDSVSFDEITLGDNDQLSAMLGELMGASTLVMLTATDGLFTKNPELKGAEKIDRVSYGESLEIETDGKTLTGRGGMRTKLEAVQKLTPLGVNVIISSYYRKNMLSEALEKKGGTFFEGNPRSEKNRSHWILARVRVNTGIKVDRGAMEALRKNASLLPVGILKVEGVFNRGDSIPVIYKGEIIAYGITEYPHKEIERMKGLKSEEIEDMPFKVIIHKNNLILKMDV